MPSAWRSPEEKMAFWARNYQISERRIAMIRDSNGAQVDYPEAKLDEDPSADAPEDYDEDYDPHENDTPLSEGLVDEEDYPGDPRLDEKFPRIDDEDEEVKF